MKINLEKLKKIEELYDNSHSSELALRQMISIVLDYHNSPYTIAPDNVKLAINTLKDLGIIEESEISKIQQLNS